MKKYIKKYIDQGFVLFPCYSNKAPLTSQGFYNAHNDLEKLERQFYREDMLIGFPCGRTNGIVVIDIDINKPLPNSTEIDTRTVDDLKEEVQHNYGQLPETFEVETKSGGRHLYYLYPENFDGTISSRVRFLDKSLSLDLRADGSYVIAPDGKFYCVYDDVDDFGIENIKTRCKPLPKWIIDLKRENTNNDFELKENILPSEEIKEIRSALSYLSSDNRDTWIKIGLALKSTGSPSAYGLWNEWSQTSDKYNPDDMEKRWNGLKPKDIELASVFYEAKKYGWVTTYPQTYPQNSQKNTISSSNVSNIKNEEKKEFKKNNSFQKKIFPEELLNPPGLVGEIFEYILEKSIMPQPVFALSASLCAVGALAGRKVQTETGVRTNIYCLNVGGSGCGKEAPRKTIKELFHIANCLDLACVEDLASDTAIVTAMDKNPSQIFLLDEIGRFLESTKKGSTHLYNIISVLLKMYSSSDQIFNGKDYADKNKKMTIMQPNLCLLGTTVPDTLYKGLNYESATDGFLSRMLIFETDNNRPRKQRKKNFLIKPGNDLIEKIKLLKMKPIKLNPEGNLDHLFVPEPQIVYLNENAHDLINDFDDYIYDLRENLENENRIEATYNRTAQLAEQIALILATGNNIENPVITESEMSYGIMLAKHLSDHMQYIIENFMAKNDFEHEVKRILNIIRKAGSISLSEISKRTQNLQGYLRNDILETLKESKQVQEALVGTGVYVTRMFTAI